MSSRDADYYLGRALLWVRDNIETKDAEEEACLIFLYAFIEHDVKCWESKGCSYEQAFWIDFEIVTCCLWGWEVSSEREVRLSKILELYLKIYCKEMDLRFSEQPGFFSLLKDKYSEINRIIQYQDPESVGMDLWRLIYRQIHKGDEDFISSFVGPLTSLDMMRNQVGKNCWKVTEDI